MKRVFTPISPKFLKLNIEREVKYIYDRMDEDTPVDILDQLREISYDVYRQLSDLIDVLKQEVATND